MDFCEWPLKIEPHYSWWQRFNWMAPRPTRLSRSLLNRDFDPCFSCQILQSSGYRHCSIFQFIVENYFRLLIDGFEIITLCFTLTVRWISVSCKLTLGVLFIASVYFAIAAIWLNSIVVSSLLKVHVYICIITIASLVIISSILVRVWLIISGFEFFFFIILLFSLFFFLNFLLDVVWRKAIVDTWL